MEHYLISEAIGDVAGSAYEGRGRRIKDYDKVKMFSSRAHFTDDTVLTFACAEAFIDGLDMTMNLWKCANEHRHAGFSSTFKKWFASHKPQPYRSLGETTPLLNREMHLDWKHETDVQSAKSDSQSAKESVQSANSALSLPPKCKNCTLEELAVLRVIQQEPAATQKHIATEIGKSERTVKSITVRLTEQGILVRKNGKRNGYWEIVT